ncbi:MAG: dipeptide ABC transporter ATP-binding protein [Pseudomonadota bacterium]
MNEALLKVENLKKHFPIRGGILNRSIGSVFAVDGVSFEVKKGTTLGLVGESGCGKSTLGRTLLRLYEPTEGKAFLEGKDIFSLDRHSMFEIRKDIQMIFQDPYSSLNPRMTVGDIIREPLDIYKIGSATERRERLLYLTDVVGMKEDILGRYPHEFSGGQRQRIGIARALALNPKLIVADEPISALDVSIRSQILNLIADLQERFSLTYIFISHDLSVVEYISDTIAVMYLGKIVEKASKRALFDDPKHPYTIALMSAIPEPDPTATRKRIILKGDIPSQSSPPKGCPFHTRCYMATEECSKIVPELKNYAGDKEEEHLVACVKAKSACGMW